MNLVKFCEMLGQNSGMLTISHLITPENRDEINRRNEIVFEMQKELEREGLEALTEVNVVNDFKKGMYTVAASHGIAGLKTNMVVFGWSHTHKGRIKELEIIHDLAMSGKNIMMLHFNRPFKSKKKKRIDIWWRGKENNSDMMLLLSYLIQLNTKWKKSEIQILSLADTVEDQRQLEQHIDYSIKEARIHAKVKVVLRDDGDVLDQLLNLSKKSDLVFTGLARQMEDPAAISARINRIVSGLPAVAFVQNNGMKSDTPIIFGTSNSK